MQIYICIKYTHPISIRKEIVLPFLINLSTNCDDVDLCKRCYWREIPFQNFHQSSVSLDLPSYFSHDFCNVLLSAVCYCFVQRCIASEVVGPTLCIFPLNLCVKIFVMVLPLCLSTVQIKLATETTLFDLCNLVLFAFFFLPGRKCCDTDRLEPPVLSHHVPSSGHCGPGRPEYSPVPEKCLSHAASEGEKDPPGR